jgi:nucleotide-binding universal stress UspA family protein
MNIARILVPVDLDPRSKGSTDAAVSYAADLAARFGAAVDVMHVYEPDEAAPDEDALLDSFSHSPRHRDMEDYLSALEHRGISVRGRVAKHVGPIASTIVDVAYAGKYDLVVLGAHQRGFWSGLLGRHVVERVSRTAPCPVVVVPSEDLASQEVEAHDQSIPSEGAAAGQMTPSWAAEGSKPAGSFAGAR